MKLIAALLCVLAPDLCGRQGAYREKRIVNGQPVTTDSYPYMASLQYYNTVTKQWQHWCGAVLIRRYKLLTAAHCVYQRESWLWRVVFGVSSIRPSNIWRGQIRHVQHIVVHAWYWETNGVIKDNDIAMIYLYWPVSYSKRIQPAKLVKKGTSFVDSKCAVTGWGHTRNMSDPQILATKTTFDLMHAKVTKIPLEDCQAYYQGISVIRPTFLCLFEENQLSGFRPDTCQSDSGGPVMCGDKLDILTGLTSFGKGCGDKLPGVYTRVSRYLDWINRQ